MEDYQVLLYYNYTHIEDPEALRLEQIALCEKYNLTSRIIVATEGINGTLEGKSKDIAAYIEVMKLDHRFADTHFKISEGTGSAFPKISVKVRSELVSAHLGDRDVDPNKVTGKHLTAEELHEWINAKKEFYIVDMRNDYEHKVGYFENSILAPLKNFRDLPDAIEELAYLRDKPVVTVCTGGVRCEKASGFLVENGFNDVYQLFGGIQTYMEKYPNQDFLGKLYVFDGRVTWALNPSAPEHVIVAKCDNCGTTCDQYVDCAYVHCKGHRHFICCDDCKYSEKLAFCSEECKELALADLESNLFVRNTLAGSSV